MGACVTSAWAGLLVGPQLKQKRGNENGRLGQWAREGDRDGPPEAKAEWGAGSGPHGAEGSRTDRSSGEREKVSFHFQIFPISFF